MKIICICNNYGTEDGAVPYYYTVADFSMVKSDNPVFLPENDTRFEIYPSVAVRITRLGKFVAPRFAERYYEEMTVGVSVVAATRLQELRQAGLPWSEAVTFDRSLPLGNLLPKGEFESEELRLTLTRGGNVASEDVIEYSLSQLKMTIAETIAWASRYGTLKIGDLLLVGLPAKGIEVQPEDRFTAVLGEKKLLSFKIK